MTDEQRSAPGSTRHVVTGDVHLVLLDEDGRVLLGRRKDTGFADGAYHLPAGHLEAGESVIDALIREAREETGILISPDAIDFAHVMHNSSGGRIAFFFIVRRWDGIPQNTEPEKCSELRWAPVRALPGNLVDYARVALAAIADGKRFSLYGWQDAYPSTMAGASWCRVAAMMKTLGHSQRGLTMYTCTHVLPKVEREAIVDAAAKAIFE